MNRPEPNAGPDRGIAAKACLGQAPESLAAGFRVTWARAGQDLHEVIAIGAATVGACGGTLPAWAAVRQARGKDEQENRRQATTHLADLAS